MPSDEIEDSYFPTTHISVVVAARNEEHQLTDCLHSIINQDYPDHLYELIVVDDESEDRTPDVIESFGDKLVLAEPKIGQAGKKASLTAGINKAKGKLIAITDADCVVPPRWLKHFARAYEKGALFIAAPVILQTEDSVFGHFQALDMAGMMIITGAGIQSGTHYSCNGASLAFDKASFDILGGYESHMHRASGDDIFLIHEFTKKFSGDKIRFVKTGNQVVSTSGVSTIREFYSQRIRWASKASSFKDINTILILILQFSMATGIIGLAACSLFYGAELAVLSVLLLVIKGVLDYLLLREAVNFFSGKNWLRAYPLSLVLHVFYLVIIGSVSQIKRDYIWKGRKVV